METFIWENYNKDEVNDKIKYWVDLWEDLISYFNVNSYGLKLINPQLILLDTIDEIESNQFVKNKENKKYFYEKISQILEVDEVRRNFDSNRILFLSQLCKKALSIFRSGEYFEKSFQELKKIMLEKNWNANDERKIYYLSQVLIIELLLRGYNLEEIKDFPKSIFDKYSFFKVGKIIRTALLKQ